MKKLGFNKEFVEPQFGFTTIGLDGAIEAIAWLLERRNPPRYYLIVIDKEHVPDQRTLEEKLRERGFTVTNVNVIHPGHAWRITCERGAKEAVVYIAILGSENAPRIEWNLSKLISLVHHEQVKPTKDGVNRWLREKRKRDRDLITEAPKKQVEEAFKPLAKTLTTIANEDP